MKQIIHSTLYPLILVFFLWLVFIIDKKFEFNLWQYGLFPRSIKGLVGILTMPLIHGDIKHLINNSLPLVVLGSFLYLFYKTMFFQVFVYVWLVSGLWTWVFARPAFHIGASALIYGLASFIFFAGIIVKEKSHVAISLLVVFLYGSIVWGIFPIDLSQSWEGHLTGFISGTLIAFFNKKELKTLYKTDAEEYDEYADEEEWFNDDYRN